MEGLSSLGRKCLLDVTQFRSLPVHPKVVRDLGGEGKALAGCCCFSRMLRGPALPAGLGGRSHFHQGLHSTKSLQQPLFSRPFPDTNRLESEEPPPQPPSLS